MAAPVDPIQAAFEAAVRDFKARLRNDALYVDILKTKSIDDVYDTTDRLQKEQAKEGHLRHLAKIEPYLSRLREYSSTIEHFVQVKPDILALIWGPIKLLLLWTAALKTTFDAIVDVIGRIGESLPEFKTVGTVYGQNPQIKEVLLLFFKDILDFYRVTLEFFCLTRLKFVFESMWPTRRKTIEVVQQNIERHTRLLRTEARLEDIQREDHFRQEAFRHFDETEQRARLQEFRGLKTDIGPPTYDATLNTLQGLRCEGTEEWLFKDSTFQLWLNTSASSERILWIQGIPGAGKTYLSSAVVEKTRALGKTAFAFPSYRNADLSALSVIHSLVFQLAENDDDLRTILCESSQQNLKSDLKVGVRLLASILACTGQAYVIVDGLDEIGETERQRLVQELMTLATTCENLRVVLSSRPEADLAYALKNVACVIRVHGSNQGSIQAFVHSRCQDIFRNSDIDPAARAEIEGLLAPLASKAKGMFLYARIVMDSIKGDLSDILQELSVLPESLDDAYRRILARLDHHHDPRIRTKARRILGWVAFSPIPITIEEAQQALLIDPGDRHGRFRILAKLDVVNICGPIVEVVDGLIQFVHFTAKEYIASPHLAKGPAGSSSDTTCIIDKTQATLDLASCCAVYLSQNHHAPELPDRDLRHNILSGAYAFHEFSRTMWFQLVRQFFLLEKSQGRPSFSRHKMDKPSRELTRCLDLLYDCRENAKCKPRAGVEDDTLFELVKSSSPRLHRLLCRASHLHDSSAMAAEGLSNQKDSSWIELDPLTTSSFSIRAHKIIDKMLCDLPDHASDCHCNVLQRYYGARRFRCRFLGCDSRRHGFETRKSRDSHEQSHQHPWKCDVAGCAFGAVGFLSRKMRDDHVRQHSRSSEPAQRPSIDSVDGDEIRPMMADLIKAGEAETVRDVLARVANAAWLDRAAMEDFWTAAVSSADGSMLGVLQDFKKIKFNSEVVPTRLLLSSVECRNGDAFRWLVSNIDKNPIFDVQNLTTLINSVALVLSSDWVEGAEILANNTQFRAWVRDRWTTGWRTILRDSRLIRSTANIPSREQLLIDIWVGSGYIELHRVDGLRVLLKIVSTTTCSVKLAGFLLESGASVDDRLALRRTALHYVAQDTSAQAAELMKFFLLKGADPTLTFDPFDAGKASKDARKSAGEEAGARNISQWLGITWDELVEQTKAIREGGSR